MTRPILVAFPQYLVSGLEWQGGQNYLRSLFYALDTYCKESILPVLFTGHKERAVFLRSYPNTRLECHDVFSRGSLSWIIDRSLYRAIGRPILSNRAMLKKGVQLSSHFQPTSSRTLKSICWIPDLQHLHFPQFFHANEIRQRNLRFKAFLRRSDVVIVSSQSAYLDLLRFSPRYSHKARVLKFTCIPPARGYDDIDLVLAKYHLCGERYFFIPNQFWIHKNHVVAIRALSYLAREYVDVRIVCTGALSDYRNPGHLDTLRHLISSLGLDDRFLLLGLVPYDHVSRLIAGSIAVVNPSLFEGWSTSVEEAKAHGASLIVSDISVHREQCQEAKALFFDPCDPVGLAECMRLALDSGLRGMPCPKDFTIVYERYSANSRDFAEGYVSIVNELCSG